ncbi:MAG TPA: polysaccharide deacetylase family protein [Gaiellaceae bacterium]|nr:polysaccharide deacetylase family protein [Gaiellaceae bacterium]
MTPLRERRRADAAARRRRLRRRRILAVAALAAGVAGGVAVASAGSHHARTHGQAARIRIAPTVDVRPVRRVPRRLVALRPSAASRTATVPILMYHVLAPPPPGAPFPGLYVPAPEFAAQMRALARAGFHAVTLDQVRRAWLGLAGLPPSPIVLSFDNGYRTQYTVARPVLRRLHWVGDENLQLSGLPPSQGGLSAREVKALLAAGWELDTQGYSHADLPALDAASLAQQVDLGVRLIERRFGVRPHWFCYPSGRYDATVIAAVRAAGFVGATTVIPGWADRTDDPYRLPRLRVLGGTSPAALLELIRGSRGAPDPPPAY